MAVFGGRSGRNLAYLSRFCIGGQVVPVAIDRRGLVTYGRRALGACPKDLAAWPETLSSRGDADLPLRTIDGRSTEASALRCFEHVGRGLRPIRQLVEQPLDALVEFRPL